MNCYFIYLKPTQNIELIYNLCTSYTQSNYIIIIKPKFLNPHDKYKFINIKHNNTSPNRIILCDTVRSLYTISQSYLWTNTIHVFNNISSSLAGTNKYTIKIPAYMYRELMKKSLLQYCTDIQQMEFALIKNGIQKVHTI
jgi:hypothetical protein